MKFFNIFLIIVGMFCSFTEGEIHHYNLEIIEKGTTFTEGIEIDEEQKVEIFRVPAHNNVSAADFYHDFEMGVTVIKMLSEKVCYITSMDPSLPSPRKLKEDIQRLISMSGLHQDMETSLREKRYQHQNNIQNYKKFKVENRSLFRS
ncbi:uncharacterized protein [Montipora capricornis]|uniref:uncharacterized protein isoform X2 n=1 Tax=Montipora capricornis TaxID=246305 RepID=UPI0035F1B7A8